MPVKKGKGSKKKVCDETDEDLLQLDVQYNPDIIPNLLQQLHQQTELKCSQIQKDANFMATSIRQAFHLELIKIPTQVKQMPLSKFRKEYGESLDAVTRGVMAGSSQTSVPFSEPVHKSSRSSMQVFQTPSHSRAVSGNLRNPREGERILSENGSPLGEFSTVVKAPRPGAGLDLPPPTPGVFVPLKDGEVLGIENLDVDNLNDEMKEDALAKMQAMMSNMQVLMAKLQR